MAQEDLNRAVHAVLVSGMVLSLIIILVGLGLYMVQQPHFDGPIPAEDIPGGLMEGDPIAIIQLGLLVLIATPLMRIVAALLIFARMRDIKFVLISVAVLSVIVLAGVLEL